MSLLKNIDMSQPYVLDKQHKCQEMPIPTIENHPVVTRLNHTFRQ